MWRRILNRAGRASLSIAVAGVVHYVSGSEYAIVVAPLLQLVGKWMRERGFQNVPF